MIYQVFRAFCLGVIAVIGGLGLLFAAFTFLVVPIGYAIVNGGAAWWFPGVAYFLYFVMGFLFFDMAR